MSLQDLPIELIERVFSYFNYYELLRAKQWGKKFQSIISCYSTESTVSWMVSVHLNTDGLFTYHLPLYHGYRLSDYGYGLEYRCNGTIITLGPIPEEMLKKESASVQAFSLVKDAMPLHGGPVFVIYVKRDELYKYNSVGIRCWIHGPSQLPRNQSGTYRCPNCCKMCDNEKAKFCLQDSCSKHCTDVRCKGHIKSRNAVNSKGYSKRQAEQVQLKLRKCTV